MIRYFFHIAYDGTTFRGWQRQPNVRSVQEVLENQLAKALRLSAITIIGCGRTDAGVHASQYFFHVDVATALPANLRFILNKTLPASISIFDIIEVDANLHARFAAQERTYDYFIHTRKDPFISNISALYIEDHLAIHHMKQAVDLLPLYDDYKAFCKQPDLHNTTICTVHNARLLQTLDGTKLRFQITANRFLRGQIRIIVQKLLEIGRGKFSLDAFEYCLAHLERPPLIRPAHPQGLFLSKISYPSLQLPNKATFTLPDEYWQEIQ